MSDAHEPLYTVADLAERWGVHKNTATYRARSLPEPEDPHAQQKKMREEDLRRGAWTPMARFRRGARRWPLSVVLKWEEENKHHLRSGELP
jgi:hypothetical protein